MVLFLAPDLSFGPEHEIYTQNTPLNTYTDVSSQKFGLSFHLHYFFCARKQRMF